MAGPWEKYGGAAEESAGPWARYAAPKAQAETQPTNPAAANPEVITPLGTIKGEIGDTAMFNPAAALIKAGDMLSRVNRGVIEARDAIPSMIRGKPSELAARAKEDREFARQPMKELQDIHPGSTQIGDLAVMAPIPAAALPVVGAMEEGDIGERAMRAGFAVAGNQATKAAGKYLAGAPERAAAAKTQNAERDALVAAAKAEGYVFPPSASGGGAVSRTLEGLSGKAKTEQFGTVRNKPVNDKLARRELDLAPDAPLNPETLQGVRAQAYASGYRPIVELPEVVGDTALLSSLRKIAPDATGGAIKSPARQAINDEVIGPLASRGKWTGAELVQDIQALREHSAANFRGTAAEQSLARAQKDAAAALEHLAERNVIANGGSPGTVKALREARTKIAKAHDVEDALVSGSVDATKFKGDELTGGLKLMADLAKDKSLRKSIEQPAAGANTPTSVLDWAAAAYGLGSGNPLIAGLPAARVAARYGVMNPRSQQLIQPNYDPSFLSRGAPALQNSYAPALAGMFGYEMATR